MNHLEPKTWKMNTVMIKSTLLPILLLASLPALAQYNDVTTPDINEGAVRAYDDVMTDQVNEGAIDWD
jgi:hypothetical protein